MLNADDRDRLAPDASPLGKPATENNNDLDETLSWDLVSVSELSSRAASPGAALSIAPPPHPWMTSSLSLRRGRR